MKRLVLFITLLLLSILNSGLAQVMPEAQTLLDKAVQAHGGRAAIEGLRTLTQAGINRFSSFDGTWREGGYRRILDFPERQFRIEDFSNGFINGVRQFTAGAGVRWTAKDGVQKMQGPNEPVDFHDLKVLLEPMRSAIVLGPQTVQGLKGQAVRITLKDPGLQIFTYLFADDGTVLARASGSEIKADGEFDAFGDYRKVAGVRLPYLYRYFENGKASYEERALEMRANEPVRAQVFKLPPPKVSPNANIGVMLEAIPGVGIHITGLEPEGPAAKVGLKVGDLILEVDGVSMMNWNHLLQNGIPGSPKTVVVLTVRRDGKSLTFKVARVEP